MTTDKSFLNEILEELAKTLDISPSKYQQAVKRYTSVGEWLIDGEYENSIDEPDVYPQGSFRYGTVIRPLKDGKDAYYDIDLVCELKIRKEETEPKKVKNMVGDRLKENDTYKRMLDDEGKRCWTLNYAEEDGIGFHIDVLPSIPNINGYAENAILITDRDKQTGIYSWNPSNPKEYANWFEERNLTFSEFAETQKELIFESTFRTDGVTPLFDSVDKVPDQLVRTPLQRSIQILKRHRDIHFKDNPEIKPISMIITTLAAKVYQGEKDTYSSLVNIINIIYQHVGYIDDVYFRLDEDVSSMNLISRRPNEKGEWEWYIPNPVDPDENFADKWHEEDDARAIAFFKWISKVKSDMDNILQEQGLYKVGDLIEESFGKEIANDTLRKIGEKYKESKETSTLKMETSTGLLGTTGTGLTVRKNKFYGT